MPNLHNSIYSVTGSLYLLQKSSVFPPFPVSCMIGVDDHVALVYLVGNGTIWQWQCVSLIFFFLANTLGQARPKAS